MIHMMINPTNAYKYIRVSYIISIYVVNLLRVRIKLKLDVPTKCKCVWSAKIKLHAF